MDQSTALQLTSGRVLHLCEVRQWNVYENLLEGLPTREMNQRLLANILAEQRQQHGAEPFLMEPEQKPIAYEGRYPFGTPATMPPIACVARFDSEPARDLTKDYSSLVIVWFQENFSLAIEDAVKPSLEAIDWNVLATDRER